MPGIVAPTKVGPVTARIVKQLRTLQVPASVPVLERFFKTGPGQYGEGDKFLGIKNPELRTLVKAELDKGDITIADALEILKSPYNEQRFVALGLLEGLYVKAKKANDAALMDKVYQAMKDNIVPYVNNWNLVDCFVPHVMGEHLRKKECTSVVPTAGGSTKKKPTATATTSNAELEKRRRFLFEWIEDQNLWRRRTAVLTTHAFIRLDKEHEITFALVRKCLQDREDLMHKACGWMLREIGRCVSRPVLKSFLEEEAGKMPRTMLRYSIEHLDEKEKAKYMGVPSVYLQKRGKGTKTTREEVEAEAGDIALSVADLVDRPKAKKQLIGFATAVSGFSMAEVQCTVCLRAVEHMWHRGVIMRDQCDHPDRELAIDDQCHLSNVKHNPVLELVNGTCQDIHQNYQGSHSETGHFQMHLHDSPTHNDVEEAALERACQVWIHDEHTVERVARIIFSNLDARKTTNEILYPLQQRFCQKPCNMKKVPPRKMKPLRYIETHDDYSHWATGPRAHEFDANVNLEHHDPSIAAHNKVKYHDMPAQQQKGGRRNDIDDEL